MTIKEMMRQKAGIHVPINEMAQSHINTEIQKYVKAGKYNEAAFKYISTMAGMKSAKTFNDLSEEDKKTFWENAIKAQRGIRRTISKKENKLKDVRRFGWSDAQVAMFEKAINNFGNRAEIELGTPSKRKYEKKINKEKGGIDKVTGEIVKASSAQQQKGIKTKLLKTIAKNIKKSEEEYKDISSTKDEEKLKAFAEEYLKLWGYKEGKTRSTRPEGWGKYYKDHKDLNDNVLLYYFVHNKDKFDNINLKIDKITLIKKILLNKIKLGLEYLEALSKVVETGRPIKNIDGEDLKVLKRKYALIEKMRTRTPAAKNKTQRGKVMRENYINNRKIKMMAEAFEYKGAYFLENYVMSHILKSFVKDAECYGIEETAEMYQDMYGYETYPIFEYMVENEDMLVEASKIKNNLLFENYSIDEGILDFLKGLWGKIKEFGAPIVSKIGTFLSSGFTWAKELATKGIAFITSNPIAKIAVPAVAIAGGLAGGIALINKLRKKRKKPKMSKAEIKQMRLMLQKKDAEIEAMRKKGIKIKELPYEA